MCSSSFHVYMMLLQVFGGLVWILVACTLVVPQNPQGWVMFVSVFCFVMTFIWMVVFACGSHHNKASWAAAVSPLHIISQTLSLVLAPRRLSDCWNFCSIFVIKVVISILRLLFLIWSYINKTDLNCLC